MKRKPRPSFQLRVEELETRYVLSTLAASWAAAPGDFHEVMVAGERRFRALAAKIPQADFASSIPGIGKRLTIR